MQFLKLNYVNIIYLCILKRFFKNLKVIIYKFELLILHKYINIEIITTTWLLVQVL